MQFLTKSDMKGQQVDNECLPNFQQIPVVRETEILEEDLSADGAVQVIDRRAKLAIDVPYLLKKLMGVEHLLFRQKNTLDK